MRFLEARAVSSEPAQVVIQGAPYDGGTSYRAGAAGAPEQVRIASDSIESYSPLLRRDLVDVDIADAGDIDVSGLDAKGVMFRIAEATAGHAREGSAVLTLGGDHSVSIGTSAGLFAVFPNLVHIVYDAHLDMRDTYDGSELSHACGTRRMSSQSDTWAVGIRSGSRDEFADADKFLNGWSSELAIPAAARAAISERPVFVSVDLDVLDPSILPGTGNPEPGGATYRELRESLLGLAGSRVVGIDLVEVAPNWDPSGVSPVVAAELAREVILGLLTA